MKSRMSDDCSRVRAPNKPSRTGRKHVRGMPWSYLFLVAAFPPWFWSGRDAREGHGDEAGSVDSVIGRHRDELAAIAAGVVDGDNHDWFVVAVMKTRCSQLQADLETRFAMKQAAFSVFLFSEKRLSVA